MTEALLIHGLISVVLYGSLLGSTIYLAVAINRVAASIGRMADAMKYSFTDAAVEICRRIDRLAGKEAINTTGKSGGDE
jgi:hypothetical protein